MRWTFREAFKKNGKYLFLNQTGDTPKPNYFPLFTRENLYCFKMTLILWNMREKKMEKIMTHPLSFLRFVKLTTQAKPGVDFTLAR